MANNKGICYAKSGDKKKYEPDLFKAQLNVSVNEWCRRFDSDDDRGTVVFGDKDGPGEITDRFYSYLPYGEPYGDLDLRINHNIQANGEEDHYTLLGGYNNPPTKWSPPPGLDGPFDNPYDLKYPYYDHWVGFSYSVSIYYGTSERYDINTFFTFLQPFNYYYYGNKK